MLAAEAVLQRTVPRTGIVRAGSMEYDGGNRYDRIQI